MERPINVIDGAIHLGAMRLLKECGFKNIRQEKAVFKHQDPRDMRIVGENK